MPSRPKARKHGHREPSGRLSRRKLDVKNRAFLEKTETEAEAKSVGIAARIRHGIPAHLADLSDAGRPNVGTLQGKMHLMGELDRDQWQAAEWFLGRRLSWLRAIDASPVYAPSERTGEGEGVPLHEAISEWRIVTNVLQDASTQSRAPILAAFDVILVRQLMVDHMVGDLRLGLNAIQRAFLQGRQRRAA
jgi:hypothetical protein